MRVLLLSQVFPPETHPTAVMVSELAQHLAHQGHEVAVATGFPNHPAGRLPEGWSVQPLSKEMHGAVEVWRGGHLTTTSRAIPLRGAALASGALGGALASMAAQRPDVVVNFAAPLVGPLLAGAVATLRRAALVTVVYDLYPDILLDAGALRRRGILHRILSRVERYNAGRADRFVVISDGFKRRMVERGSSPDKLAVIPAWLDPKAIVPRPRSEDFRKKLGLPAGRLVLHAGTLGEIADVDTVFRAMDLLAASGEHDDVTFVAVGAGRGWERWASRANHDPSVVALPFQPREDLSLVQALSDVSLVSLAPGRGRTSVPSKVVGYLAAGRPVVAAVDEDSDTAAAIRGACAGEVVPPSDPAALASALMTWLDDAPRREAAGRRARLAFESDFARAPCLSAFERVITEAGGYT